MQKHDEAATDPRVGALAQAEIEMARKHDWRYWFDNYQEMLNANVANIRRSQELEAQLAEADAVNKEYRRLIAAANEGWEKAGADAAKLRGALKTIAEWPFDIMGDCVADARKLAHAALEAPEAAREVKK